MSLRPQQNPTNLMEKYLYHFQSNKHLVVQESHLEDKRQI